MSGTLTSLVSQAPRDDYSIATAEVPNSANPAQRQGDSRSQTGRYCRDPAQLCGRFPRPRPLRLKCQLIVDASLPTSPRSVQRLVQETNTSWRLSAVGVGTLSELGGLGVPHPSLDWDARRRDPTPYLGLAEPQPSLLHTESVAKWCLIAAARLGGLVPYLRMRPLPEEDKARGRARAVQTMQEQLRADGKPWNKHGVSAGPDPM